MKHINRPHLTAIARTRLSAPMQWLVDHNLIDLDRPALDYGCGLGTDAAILGMDGYDPYHKPNTIHLDSPNRYKTITCHYVLNVLNNPGAIAYALWRIQSLLTDDGIGYVSVRADAKNLNGYTSRGTYQGDVRLNLPIVHEQSGRWRMYRLLRSNRLADILPE